MDWLIVGADAVAAAVFVNAGVAKAVSPSRLAAALAELPLAIGGQPGERFLRAFAVIELAVAGSLIITALRAPAAVAAGALGLCFCAVGILGLLNGSRVPCGCFGASSTRPFGWVNIGIGLALAGIAPLNVMARPSSLPGGYTAAAFQVCSAAVVLVCLWANRRLVAGSLRRPGDAPAGREVG